MKAENKISPILTQKVEVQSEENKIFYEPIEKKMIVITKNYIQIFNQNATKILHDVNINIFENNLFDNSVSVSSLTLPIAVNRLVCSLAF